ncbi:hypothetical protein [Sorangium sp. So ce176]|uniref:hypothetical protein n=1 Tax=Sorangium sp. So ce176 TaxID=3133286 RepID=UPI003F5E1332
MSAFRAFRAREGSTAAVDTCDSPIVTSGTGWGGRGRLGKVMERPTASDAVREALGAADVRSTRLPLPGIFLPDAQQEVLYREGTAALSQGLQRGVADHVHDRAPRERVLARDLLQVRTAEYDAPLNGLKEHQFNFS